MAIITNMNVNEQAPFPNSALPVLLCQEVFAGEQPDFRGLFARHGWGGMWVNGVYGFHHFHATAHEALGCLSGWGEVKLGGPLGSLVRITQGDAVLIPAGVAHQLVASSPDFSVLGAYPKGQSPDLQRGDKGDYARLKALAADVPRPDMDPVLGKAGGAHDHWLDAGREQGGTP